MERAVAAAGLRIDCRHRVGLSPADVRDLWSEYDDRGHVLSLAFLDRYLTGGPSEVLLLHGPDAFEATRRIKREVRSRYASGPYANVVHAAERRGEMARQAGLLLGRCGVCAGPFVSDEPPHSPRRPPGIDFGAYFDVAALVDEVWPLITADVPADPGPGRVGEPSWEAAVCLGPDRQHTLDSTVTALWHSVPGVEPWRAVRLALHTGWSGGTAIAVGDRRALERCLATLREHGITNCGIGPYRPARPGDGPGPWSRYLPGPAGG